MGKRKGPSDRARAWAKKWADYNHPELPANADNPEHTRAYQSALWIGFFTGGSIATFNDPADWGVTIYRWLPESEGG